MATDTLVPPPPPPGFELEVPPPPPGFELEQAAPSGVDLVNKTGPVGTFQGLGEAFKRGLKMGGQIPDVAQAIATKPGFSVETRPATLGMTGHFIPAIGRLLQAQQAGIPWYKETVRDIAATQKQIAESPKSEAQQRLAQAQSQSEKWAAWRKDPFELTATIVLESLPPSLLGAGLGVAGGPPGVAAGVGAASAATEFSNSFLSEAGRKGYDVTDEKQLQAFLDNAKDYEEAFGKALTRSAIIGGVDATTAGTAGSFVRPALQKGLRALIAPSIKEIGLQAAGGALGEAGGQLAAKQPLDLFDIAMEALAEVGTGPAEVVSNVRQSLKGGERVERQEKEEVPLERGPQQQMEELTAAINKALEQRKEGDLSDTQVQERISGVVPQGQEPGRAIPQQVSGAETPTPSGVLQAQEGLTAEKTGIPVGDLGWSPSRASYVEGVTARTGKEHVPAILYDSGDVIPGTSHGTLMESAPEGARPLSSGWTDKKGKFTAGSNPPSRSATVQPTAAVEKPDWVRTLEQVERQKNLNEAQAERLAAWRKANPTAEGPESKEEYEKRKGVSLLYAPEAVAPKILGTKFKSGVEQDATQMLNWLRNTQPSEYALLEASGIRQAFPQGSKATPEQLGKWVQENARVETHAYGMEGKPSEAKREYDKMTHEWYDQLPAEQQLAIGDRMRKTYVGDEPPIIAKRISKLSAEDQVKAKRYEELYNQYRQEPRDTSPRATSTYETVSAFNTHEPMPEWTTSKEGRNVQRVDVVIPRQGDIPYEQWVKEHYSNPKPENEATYRRVYEAQVKAQRAGGPTEKMLWQSDNLHENLPNTLGWAMIQYKTGPNGEKIAFIAEAQSRWGQERYKNEPIKATLTADEKQYKIEHRDKDKAPTYVDVEGYGRGRYTAEEALQVEKDHWKRTYDTTPLLRDYNRLILKAAIEQARKEGATHIVISDAETAMMTEGHDLQAQYRDLSNIKQVGSLTVVKWLREGGSLYRLGGENSRSKTAYLTDNKGELLPIKKAVVDELENKGIIEYRPEDASNQYDTYWRLTPDYAKLEAPQEPGMRFNYDTLLPRITEELTGAKGERVELGEHKNAFENSWPQEVVQRERYMPRETKMVRQPRQNLIFRNPDGTPKTSASGLMFPLKATREQFSLTGKDKPVVQQPSPKASREEMVDINALDLSARSTAFDALQNMAKNRRLYTEEQRALADFLVRNFEPALRATGFDLYAVGDEGRTAYDPETRKILLGLGTDASHTPAFKLLHESAHAATYWQFEHPATLTQQRAAEEIRYLFEESKKRLGPDADYYMQYYHKNTAEFIAGVFSSAEFRKHLNDIKVTEQSFLERFWDAVKQLLGVKSGSALDRAFDALIEVGAERETGEQQRQAYLAEQQGAPPNDPLPFRFREYAQQKKENTEPRFLGKVPLLNKLIDERAKRTTPEEKVILNRAVAEYELGSGVTLWLEQMKDRERAFKKDAQGRITLADGSKHYLSDVMEKVLVGASFPFTPAQEKVANLWRRMNAEGVRYAQEQGVKFFLDEYGNPRQIEEGYFPRVPIGVKKGGGALPGAKPKNLMRRAFKTEEEGFKAGVRYMEDEYAIMGNWLQGVYRAVADARLARDADLGGRLGIRLVPIEDAKGVQRLMLVGKGPKRGEGQVYGVPALRQKVFDIDTAKRLQDFYSRRPGKYALLLGKANQEIKGSKFAGDISSLLNQGLPLLFYRPGRWAKAATESLSAFAQTLVTKDSLAINSYLKDGENAAIAREYVDNGGSIGRMQDFLEGTRKEAWVSRIPVYGRMIRAGGESMSTFLSIGKLELYKALKPLSEARGESKAALVELTENMVLSGRMEALGMSQGRQLAERLIFNAPSYLRAAASLAYEGAKGAGKTVTGQRRTLSESVARNALLGLATSLTLLSFAAYKMQGLDDDEIKERLDPRSWKFMRFRVPLGNEQAVEMGIGNIFLSIARLLGTTAEVVTGEKKVKPGVQGDPFLRWLTYREAPWINFLKEIITGRDFRDLPTGKLESLGRTVVPLPIEQWFEGAEGTREKAMESAVQFAGGAAMKASEPTPEELMRTKGRTPEARWEIAKEVKQREKLSLDEQMLMQKRATENEFERRKETFEALPKEQRKMMEAYGLQLPASQSSLTRHGLRLPLTKEERKLEQAFVVEEYTKAIGRFMQYEASFDEWKRDGSLQQRLNNLLARAREAVRRRVAAQISTPDNSRYQSGDSTPSRP